jgi:hypothetical protein
MIVKADEEARQALIQITDLAFKQGIPGGLAGTQVILGMLASIKPLETPAAPPTPA